LYHLNLTGAAKSRKKTEKQSFNLNPALLFIRKKGKDILGIMQAMALIPSVGKQYFFGLYLYRHFIILLFNKLDYSCRPA
jgi:hypothetical protein